MQEKNIVTSFQRRDIITGSYEPKPEEMEEEKPKEGEEAKQEAKSEEPKKEVKPEGTFSGKNIH